MGATTYLVPPLTIFLGWLLLDESPAPLAYLGGVLCLIGVAISRYRSAPDRGADTGRQHGQPGLEPAVEVVGETLWSQPPTTRARVGAAHGQCLHPGQQIGSEVEGLRAHRGLTEAKPWMKSITVFTDSKISRATARPRSSAR